VIDGLPYRREAGREVSGRLPDVPLPPSRMPLLRGGRPLKRWRYVGAFCDELMLCVARAHVGPTSQSFWAVWDRRRRSLRERTNVLRGAGVELGPGRVRILDRAARLQLELELDEGPGVETICASGSQYVWTRKQGGVPARGTIAFDGGRPQPFAARAAIDDTAGYHDRFTEWWWAAGVGTARDGRELAWNLVAGVNDPPRGSERTVWVDRDPCEPPPARFAADLSTIAFEDGAVLRFAPEAERRRRENLLVVRSDYRQPFGTFAGTLPAGIELARGVGVTEHHRAWW
jgi:hypothetical protein